MVEAVIIISLFLFLAYSLLIIYYSISWRSIPTTLNLPGRPADLKPQACLTGRQALNLAISIIIPARNESQNISACLDSIMGQSYPKEQFEVIVVDDHSTDDTAAIVQGYAGKNVRLISLKEALKGERLNSYKKKAIEIAISQSSGEMLVTTDADCIVPKNWLQTIASFQQENNAAFIAMPVGYNCSNRPLEIFQALDFMTLQGITGASVHKRMHSMCNGANLAYSKKVFYEVNGFKDIDNIASGDDMLLMHKVYKQHPDKVFFLKSKEVIVQTQPMQTLKDFFNQRIRWASKADKYDDKRIFAVLLLVYLFNVWLLMLVMAAVFFHPNIFYLLAGLLAGKTIVELFFLYPVAWFFNQQKLLLWFPVAQPFHICYTVIAGWLGKFGSYQWKGRTVK
jgi:cellulose synthase/poly-beta-1,6-N-acetylglucosamine synthase-like glycosyltransferase